MLTVNPKETLCFHSPYPEMVRGLVEHLRDRWGTCSASLTNLGPRYSRRQKVVNERQLNCCLNRLTAELEPCGRSRPDREGLREQVLPLAAEVAKVTFGLEDQHIAALGSYGFVEAIQEFVRKARRFDAAISAADLYQAGRNAWSMIFIQLMLGLPVEVTPSVLAYSLLYPYTDNYLDDPAMTLGDKKSFSARIRQRLEGRRVSPASSHEQKIFDLLGMIEVQYERGLHPEVYDSLMAVHRAQTNSLNLQHPNLSQWARDVLGIVFEKGGTSVLADGYLVAGSLTPPQRELMFYYGAFTQLMDDLEDVDGDLRSGIMTMFSQTARHGPLDALTNRTIHLGAGLLESIHAFEVPGLEPLEEIMRRCITPILIDSAGRAGHLYSRPYLVELEEHFPFRFSNLKQQRKKAMCRLSADRIFELVLTSEDDVPPQNSGRVLRSIFRVPEGMDR